MFIIGLTGGVASGKSTVTAYLKSRGHIVVDCDEISRNLYSDATYIQGLKNLFRSNLKDITDSKGNIDKGKFGSFVFSNNDAMQQLNAYAHPIIFNCIAEQLADARDKGYTTAFIDAPVLFESGLDKVIDFYSIWCVKATKKVQTQRLRKRGKTSAQIQAILGSQMSNSERANRSDYIIVTTNSKFEDLYAQVDIGLRNL